ncbi:MAG: sulfotransferase, partial [Pseudomonadota bacterium]|nr:sulfotransferase [Pseudomonadota bacterium]
SREKRLAFWGPQLDGMAELLEKHPLDEVCALQWQACVDKAADAFAAMPADRWLEIAYEDFVREPESEFARVIEFLGVDVASDKVKQTVVGVRADSIGKGRAALNDDALQRIDGLVDHTLARYGYV